MRNAFFAVIAALCLAWGGAVGSLAAQEFPPKPADGIRDDTRAFTETEHAQLAAKVAEARQVLNCDIWLAASTFLTSGENLRGFSRELRQSWSDNNEAILLAYDRASDKQFLSFSPSLWERYPPADLASLMHRSAAIVAERERPIGERLTQMMEETLRRLTALEKQRQRLAQSPLPRDHFRLAKLYAGGAGAVMLVLLVACGLLRRRAAVTDQQLSFPNVQVATRFGAPYGSQITDAGPPRT